MKVKQFEDLEIWQLARELCADIYHHTVQEPFANDFKLKGQIRGSSGSIMDNIAEGFERGGNNEFLHFLSIAKGSCGETRSQLYRAMDCGHINEKEFELLKEKTLTITRKTASLMNYLKTSEIRGPKYK
jgi:four helix bundle protein